MKKILVFIVITAFLFSGCGTNTEQISGNDINEEQKMTEDKSNLPTPHADELAWIFNTEQEFVASIIDGSTENDGSKHSIKEMKYYFIPEVVPEGVTLDHIAVKDFYVALWYTYDKEPDPYWERLFIFEWYRTKKTGDTEMNVKRHFPEEEIKRKNEYYIVKIEPWDGYTGDNEYVCQDVYWEKSGYAFHAVVPIWFTEADIEKYCVAKKVNVK